MKTYFFFAQSSYSSYIKLLKQAVKQWFDQQHKTYFENIGNSHVTEYVHPSLVSFRQDIQGEKN